MASLPRLLRAALTLAAEPNAEKREAQGAAVHPNQFGFAGQRRDATAGLAVGQDQY
jgi:hypothetical protein